MVAALVVIELKVSQGYNRVVGQLLRYVSLIRQNVAGARSEDQGHDRMPQRDGGPEAGLRDAIAAVSRPDLRLTSAKSSGSSNTQSPIAAAAKMSASKLGAGAAVAASASGAAIAIAWGAARSSRVVAQADNPSTNTTMPTRCTVRSLAAATRWPGVMRAPPRPLSGHCRMPADR